MDSVGLGKIYRNGETIISQGDSGNCMFVIQEGKVEVLRNNNGTEIRLAVRNEGDFFGEMSLFSKEVRSATIKALGEARILTVDKKNLLGSIQKDPSLAFRIIETLSRRVGELSDEITMYKSTK